MRRRTVLKGLAALGVMRPFGLLAHSGADAMADVLHDLVDHIVRLVRILDQRKGGEQTVAQTDHRPIAAPGEHVGEFYTDAYARMVLDADALKALHLSVGDTLQLLPSGDGATTAADLLRFSTLLQSGSVKHNVRIPKCGRHSGIISNVADPEI